MTALIIVIMIVMGIVVVPLRIMVMMHVTINVVFAAVGATDVMVSSAPIIGGSGTVSRSTLDVAIIVAVIVIVSFQFTPP